MNWPVLGIIGGVGPLATAYFMEALIRHTPASRDQDHMPMIVFNLGEKDAFRRALQGENVGTTVVDEEM